MILTINTEHVMMAILLITGSYFILRKRKWFWKYKEIIFTLILGSLMVALMINLLVTIITRHQVTRNTEIVTRRYENLPGKWTNLYKSIASCRYYEAKLSAIKSFTNQYKTENVDPLPAVGFDQILAKLAVPGYRDQTKKYIKRAKEMLQPYIIPFVNAKHEEYKPKKLCSNIAYDSITSAFRLVPFQQPRECQSLGAY